MATDSVEAPGLGRVEERVVDSMLLFLGTVAFCSVLVTAKFVYLGDPDAMEYASIARELNRGNGFATKSMTTLSVYFQPTYLDHPTLFRPPVYPLLLAASQRLFGPTSVAGVALNVAVLGAIAVVVYALGRTLYDRRVALVAGILTALSVSLVRHAMLGLTEPVYTLLFVALLLELVRRHYLRVGVLLGLSYLTHYSTLFLVPGIVVFALLHEPTLRGAVVKVLGTGVVAEAVVVPWQVRNYLVTGDPFFHLQRYELAMFTGTYPGYSLYHSLVPVSPVAFALSHPEELLLKSAQGMQTIFLSVPDLFLNWLVLPLAAIGLYRSNSRRVRLLLGAVVVMIVVQAVALAVVHTIPRLFVRFVPVVALLAANGIVVVGDGIRLPRAVRAPRLGELPVPRVRPGALAVVLTLLVVAPNVVFVGFMDTTPAYVEAEQEAFADIRALIAPEDAVVSDTPWTVAWYGDRASVWVPSDPETLTNELADVDYIYISSRGDVADFEMTAILDSTVVAERFVVVRRYDSGAVLLRRSGS